MHTQDAWTAKPPPSLGFSLLETVVAMAVVVLLVSMTMGILDRIRGSAAVRKARAELAFFASEIDAIHHRQGEFPEACGPDPSSGNHRLFCALFTSRTGNNPELAGLTTDTKREVLLDPWGHPYVYAYCPQWTHGRFFLFSMGPDGLADLPGESGAYRSGSTRNLDNVMVR